VFHIQMTLNNRIAKADGTFWEPFPWGDEETAFLTRQFREADTWVLGRRAYETIVPWWDKVAAGEVPEDASAISAAEREFAGVLKTMTKVVLSTTLEPRPDRVVIGGDVGSELEAMKRQGRKDILLSCGPATHAQVAGIPGLIDEYLLSVSPAVVGAGPRLFDGVGDDIGLELAAAKVFSGGAVLLRYRVLPTQVETYT
jgi:dihydrofolate reductase